MERTCVVVADRMRARIFEAEPVDKKNKHHRYNLEEKIDLVNIWANESGGTRKESAEITSKQKGVAAPGYDSKQRDEDHDDRLFAKEISQNLHDFFKTQKTNHLYLIAPPRFLGALRAHEKMLSRDVHDIKEIPKQLSNLSVNEIRAFLEEKILH